MFFDWIISHYQLVASVIALLVSIIMFIVRKKPVYVIEGIIDYIYKNAPGIINEVEAMANGSKYIEYEGKVTPKIDVAIILMIKKLEILFPANEVKIFSLFIRNVIENILSTPQKKK